MFWQTIDGVTTPSGDEITLRQRGDLFEIRYNGIELMSNVNHHSEEQLALRLMRRLEYRAQKLLIGGLGMGFTLRAVLDHAPSDAEITVCELIPEVAAWNVTHLAHLAGAPLSDPRVRVVLGDIRQHLARSHGIYDLILMDTDNGPDIIIRQDNEAIYGAAGLDTLFRAMRPDGMAAFWSATASPSFEATLTEFGWRWERDEVALIPGRVDAMHYIYTCPNDAALHLRRAA